MTKKTKDTSIDTNESSTKDRKAPKRKKVYERVREGHIPAKLKEHFKKDEYDLRLVRWSLRGKEDFGNLNRREREGYEFVTMDELPNWYKDSIRAIDTPNRKGLVTVNDLCLMKVDTDLRNSRREVYQSATARELESVDMHVLEKKGFRNAGSSSKRITAPGFQE